MSSDDQQPAATEEAEELRVADDDGDANDDENEEKGEQEEGEGDEGEEGEEGDDELSIRRKRSRNQRYHLVRPHNNPLADNRFPHTPFSPADVNWASIFPAISFSEQPSASSSASSSSSSSKADLQEPTKKVRFVDIGCGYGGLSRALGLLYPEELVLGIEIRQPVVDHFREKLRKLQETNPGKYLNVGVERANAMRYLPAYFGQGQITKMFFLFPDPHFKKRKHRWRIISPTLLAEYAFVLAEGALVYTISDVLDLHLWMVKHFTQHPLFERVGDAELEQDPAIPLVYNSSEESGLVQRKQNDKHLAVFRRIADPYQRPLN